MTKNILRYKNSNLFTQMISDHTMGEYFQKKNLLVLYVFTAKYTEAKVEDE